MSIDGTTARVVPGGVLGGSYDAAASSGEGSEAAPPSSLPGPDVPPTAAGGRYGSRPVGLGGGGQALTVAAPALSPAGITPASAAMTVARGGLEITDARDLCQLALPAPVPVAVVGVEGGAGRTTIVRELARQAIVLRGAESAVCVDAVPMWGRLTREADLRGAADAVNAAGFAWPQGQGWSASVSWSLGTPLLAGPDPRAIQRSEPAAVVRSVEAMTHRAGLVIVDTVADPMSYLASALIGYDAAVVVAVATAHRSSVWAVQQLIDGYAAIAPSLSARTVVAVRGVARRWSRTALAAVELLRGRGLEVIELPYVSRLAEQKLPANYTEAGTRLLASVIQRGIAIPPSERTPR